MLSTADSTLGQVSDALQFAREELVSAGNGGRSSADRALIAQQLSGVRDQLVSLANSRDGAGGYVFGGQGATTAPFDASSGQPVAPAPAPTAQGSHPGEQYTGLDAKYTTSQDGRAIFADAAGNTLFAALDTIVGVLGDANASAADVSAALSTATDELDAGLERLGGDAPANSCVRSTRTRRRWRTAISTPASGCPTSSISTTPRRSRISRTTAHRSKRR